MPVTLHYGYSQASPLNVTLYKVMLCVIVVNTQWAWTVASLLSDLDQWLASRGSRWEHCCCYGEADWSALYVDDWADVSSVC